MPTKLKKPTTSGIVNTNTNTNVNKITINVPKQRAPAKPRQKSMAQAEQELANLEMNDSIYQPRAYTTDVPINPSIFGFSHLPVNRDITSTTREEPMLTSEAPAAVEPPVARVRKKRGPNKPKVAIGDATNQTLLTDYLGSPVYAEPSGYYTDAGYVTEHRGFTESPMLTKMYEKVKADFPARERYIAEASGTKYIQSPLDLALAKTGGPSPKMTKMYSGPTTTPATTPRTPYVSGAESAAPNPLAQKKRFPKKTKEEAAAIKADKEAIKAFKAKEAEAKAKAKENKTTLRGMPGV